MHVAWSGREAHDPGNVDSAASAAIEPQNLGSHHQRARRPAGHMRKANPATDTLPAPRDLGRPTVRRSQRPRIGRPDGPACGVRGSARPSVLHARHELRTVSVEPDLLASREPGRLRSRDSVPPAASPAGPTDAYAGGEVCSGLSSASSRMPSSRPLTSTCAPEPTPRVQ